MSDERIETILRSGIWMGDYGPQSWALTIHQVKSVLTELERASLPVLGGDVYEFEEGNLRPAYMNWHSDPGADESDSDFAARSLSETVEYLRSIGEAAERYRYVLVFGAVPNGESVIQF